MKKVCFAGLIAAVFPGLPLSADGVVFTNGVASLVLSADGKFTSLRERVSRRELLSAPTAAVRVEFEDGSAAEPVSVRNAGAGKYVFTLSDGRGEATLSVVAKDWGFVISPLGLTAGNALKFVFASFRPVRFPYVSSLGVIHSDMKSAVSLRPCDILCETVSRPALEAFVRPGETPGWRGSKAALIAGPRGKMIPMFRAAAVFAGVPRSAAGGPWSLDAEENRGGYVFAAVDSSNVDGWIRVAERCGLTTVHMTSWWKTLGHYDVDTKKFPDGFDGLKAACDKIRQAGFQVGSHTLTASIGRNDRSVTPICSSDIEAVYVYSLARPLGRDDTTVYVDSMPGPLHGRVTTFSSSNYLRIGGELMQYSGVNRETKPYSFTGVKRGVNGTARGGYPAGERCDFPRCRFASFFPAPDTPLWEEIISSIVGFYNRCGMERLYFDGSEGGATYYSRVKFQHDLVTRLDQSARPFINETSAGAPYSWWYRSRSGAVDHPLWGNKAFADTSLRNARLVSEKWNFLAPQGGWWCLRLADASTRGHFTDEAEFFAAKALAYDVPPSLQLPRVTGPNVPAVHVEDMMTIIGWYERARLARAFTADAKSLCKGGRSEVRLRQDDDGVWRMRRIEAPVHRAGCGPQSKWKEKFSVSGGVALRVEALYGCDTGTVAGVLLKASGDLKCTAAKGMRVAERRFGTSRYGTVVEIKAENVDAPRKASWVVAGVEHPFPYHDSGQPQYGVWMRGDGSGALVNLQVRMGREYFGSISDHHVRLDFTGWRFVPFLARERDAARRHLLTWPYGSGYSVYRNWFNCRRIAAVNVYVNDVPPGSTACVAVSDILAYPRRKLRMERPVVTVNGQRCELPFAIESGEFAELEDGGWIRYSEQGERMERADSTSVPQVTVGENTFAFDAEVSGGGFPRAEITVFGFGEKRDAFVPLTDGLKSGLAYEAMRPMTYAPARGFLKLEDVVTRPGEKAGLDVSVVGPVADPVFSVGGRSYRLPTLSKGEIYRLGEIPVVSGRTRMAMSSSGPESANARVSVVKRYLPGGTNPSAVRREPVRSSKTPSPNRPVRSEEGFQDDGAGTLHRWE